MDLSCNELTEVTLPEVLPPKLQELDLTGNPRLNLDHKSLELLKYDPAPASPVAVLTRHVCDSFFFSSSAVTSSVSGSIRHLRPRV